MHPPPTRALASGKSICVSQRTRLMAISDHYPPLMWMLAAIAGQERVAPSRDVFSRPPTYQAHKGAVILCLAR